MSFLVAKSCEAVNKQGSKRPMYMTCANQSGLDHELLVKVARPGQIDENHLAAELVSAVLLSGLEIQVATHHVVIIDDPYLGTINESLNSLGENLTLTHGYGVGAENTPGIQPIAVDVEYASSYWADASVLYAFDLFSTHYDRLTDNANCGTYGGHLFAYDFDQCFPDVTEPMSLYADRQPWQVARVSWREGHLFRAWLKRKGLDFDAIRQAFSSWNDPWWSQNRPIIPKEWESVADSIWSQAQTIPSHLDRFVEELDGSLT